MDLEAKEKALEQDVDVLEEKQRKALRKAVSSHRTIHLGGLEGELAATRAEAMMQEHSSSAGDGAEKADGVRPASGAGGAGLNAARALR